MDIRKHLLDYFKQFVGLTDDEFNRIILPYIIIRKFDKKIVLTEAGEVDNYLNYVDKGLVRKFYKKGNEEFNTLFAFEGQIIHSQESFYSRTPSEYFIETIEPSVVVSISHDELEKIYAHSLKMEHLGRLMITRTMILKDKWRIRLLKMTPRERFLDFVTTNPELMQRVPQKFLASYLNIQAETFSRFKHLLKNHTREVKQE